MKQSVFALVFLLGAVCSAAPQAAAKPDAAAAAERKKQAELLDMRLKNAIRKRDESTAQLMRLRSELLRKDPELQKKYADIVRLYSEIAISMEQKKEVRNLVEIISRLDADIREMQKQKSLQK